MNISKEDINISHYLIGFHSFTKDHNFPKFKGDLTNDFESELKLTFDAFSVGREHIIRTMDRNADLFEIRLTPQALIYQDVLPLERVIENSLKFLSNWRKYSNLINLRLVGLVRYLNFEIEPNKNASRLNITERFFKDLQFGDKFALGNFGLKFNKTLEKQTYNIHLQMTESMEPEYRLAGIIDFNQISTDRASSHNNDDIHRIFNRSTQYFENEFIELLNK